MKSINRGTKRVVGVTGGRHLFYREVLGPSDLDKVKAALMKSRNRRVDSDIIESTSHLVRTQFADCIGNLREFTGFALAAEMTDSFAELIVEEYLWCRDEQVVTAKTAANYTRKSKNLLERYRAELGIELLDDLSPVTAVMCLFEQAKKVTPATWKQYRSALLYAFRVTREYQNRRSKEHKAYDRAIALLAIVNEPPYVDARAPKTSADRRKGVPTADYEAVLLALKVSPVNRSLTAMDFAIATLATGLRPGEWANACLLEPDAVSGMAPTVLRVRSAKTKHNDEDAYRSLVLHKPEVQAVVRRHLRNVWAEIESADPAWRVAPHDNLIKKCSARINDECKRLWPTNKRRWFTLYSLRHQAAANIKKVYGKSMAAGMLGHSTKVSSRHYARVDRASKVLTLGVAPGGDVVERIKANSEADKQRGETSKVWEVDKSDEAHKLDPDADVDKPDDDSERGGQPS